MYKRLIMLLMMCLCLVMTASGEGMDWLTILKEAYPEAEIISDTVFGLDGGILAILREDGHTLAVIADKDEQGEVRFHVNRTLFAGEVQPTQEAFWLGDDVAQNGRPFLTYLPQDGAEGFFLRLERDVAGVWRISHAEFDREGSSTFCAYTEDGMTATVYGETLYPQVRTLVSIDLAFTAFDPAEAEAHCRLILAAPEKYRCYGLACSENGPCRVHGIYLPDAQEGTP